MSNGPPRTRSEHLRDPRLPSVFSRAEAREAGMSDRQIDRRLAAGVWKRLRRGCFELNAAPASSEPARAQDDSAKASLVATAMALKDREVAVSHQSAALLYGLPNPLGGRPTPTFTGGDGPVRLRTGAHVLVAPLPAVDRTTTADGFAITTPERTVADCLRVSPPADGLAIADAALRRGIRREGLLQVLDRQKGWPGIVLARRLAQLADPRRETPLESWSAWTFDQGAVPRPIWQAEIYGWDGEFCGRVDCWWQAGLVGEADGRAKYLLAAAERGGADAKRLGQVLDLERRREQKIRWTRADVVRWGPWQVRGHASGELASEVIGRLAEASLARRFRGTIVVPPLPLPQTTVKAGPLLLKR
ncbi:type IV toxin-antitoxin system AbiEi family antitoxin domain-containing protein [Spongisporangium articulatum]|uniref:Type IV toxin-antitoxin system AbiEi family antitoxin domain-containing protein n=1 Tax=Spongisporangium articulatum TaxID=3362603 RepID=A0ABW8AHD9_9ACTN